MRKRSNPDSEPNIRRIDSKPRASKQTHGFQVHFLRGNEMVTKMFSDSIYGGKEAARRAARRFKKEMIRELPARVFRGPGKAMKRRASGSGRKTAAKKTARPAAKKSSRGARKGRR